MTPQELKKLKEEAQANKIPEVRLPDECLVQVALLNLDFPEKVRKQAQENDETLSLMRHSFVAEMALIKVFNTDSKEWLELVEYQGLEKAKVVLEGAPSVTTGKYFATTPDKKNNFTITNWDLKFDRVKPVTTEREAIIQYALWFEVHWNIPFDWALILMTNLVLNTGASNELTWEDIFPDGKPDETDLGFLLCLYRYYEKKEGSKYPDISFSNYSKAKKSVLDITTHGAKPLSRNDRGALYNLVAEIIEKRKASSTTSGSSSDNSDVDGSDIPF